MLSWASELSFVLKYKLQESLSIILAKRYKKMGEKTIFLSKNKTKKQQQQFLEFANLSNFSLDTDNAHIMGQFGTNSCIVSKGAKIRNRYN